MVRRASLGFLEVGEWAVLGGVNVVPAPMPQRWVWESCAGSYLEGRGGQFGVGGLVWSDCVGCGRLWVLCDGRDGVQQRLRDDSMGGEKERREKRTQRRRSIPRRSLASEAVEKYHKFT